MITKELFEEFSWSVSRTASTSPKCVDRFLLHLDTFHAIIGMDTELHELREAMTCYPGVEDMDLVNLEEEIGDMLWYLELLRKSLEKYDSKTSYSLFGIFSQLSEGPEGSLQIRLAGETQWEYLYDEISTAVDHMKKVIFYGKELNVQYLNLFLGLTCGMLMDIVRAASLDMENILKTNMRKLRARYPDGFEESRAANRNLEKERRAISNEVQ